MAHDTSPSPRHFCRVILLAVTLCLIGHAKGAAPLQWGGGGTGGPGTWDDTSLNWYDGTSTVTWASGGSAVFGGMAGTVTTNGEQVSSIAFETPGYLLSGSLLVPSGTLTLQADADATISASIGRATFYSVPPALTKTGAGVLTLSGSISSSSFSLNQGEIRLETPIPTGVAFTLANVSGTVLTLDQAMSSSFPISLVGGGTAGGVVQPMNTPGTAQIAIGPTSAAQASFGGVLRDNGSGVLAVQIAMRGHGEIFTNANTYSGPTSITSGSLTLQGNGSLLNSAITIGSGATLSIGATSTPVISTTLPLTIQGGTLIANGNTQVPVLNLGQVVLGDQHSTISLAQSPSLPPNHTPSSTQLAFAGITRTDHATLSVTSTNVTLSGIANDATGIAPVYITSSSGWASVAADGSIIPYAGYVTDVNSATTASHVKLTADATLSTDTAWASLSLAGSAFTTTIDLGSRTLTLSSGGFFTTGSKSYYIQNGQLSTSADEWMFNNLAGGTTIGANLGETVPGTSLTKTGAGTLTLVGTNTYSGVTTIQQGVVLAVSDASLGTGPSVVFAGGSLQAGASFSSSKNMTAIGSASVLIFTGSTFNLSLSGTITGDLTKSGTGTLTLGQTPTGFDYVSDGWISYLNATGGKFPLAGGNLRTSGSIDSLDLDNADGTLDVGGTAPANLTIASLENISANLTIDFGLGSAASDHLIVSQEFYTPALASPSFQFEFQNLGGLTMGVDYSLIDFGPGVTTPDSSLFMLAPDLTADGWAATFTSTASGVSVNFSAIPEPGSGVLLALAGGAMTAGRRRGRSRGERS